MLCFKYLNAIYIMEPIEALKRCICENYPPSIDLGPILFIVAHPDDETISASGLLQRLKKAYFIHITDGAPRDLADAESADFSSREAYAQARRHELQEAFAWAGFETVCQLQCNIIDQESSYNMAGIACRLEKIIEDIQPTFVFTHAYEGGHPDHDTASFAVWAACRLLKRKKKEQIPQTFEFTSYYGSGRGPDMITSSFIHNSDDTIWTAVLTEKECDIKKKMLDCFKSQYLMVSQFPIGIEKYRIFPGYDYQEHPHRGPLFYEFFDWGMTGDKWRELAHEAILLLKIGK